jgi:mono/diheme cytochrome c family protein
VSRRPRLLLAGALAAAALGGCGGGDDDGSTSGVSASPGERVFVETGCGSCHTLAAAGTSGTAGPSLDGRDYDVPAVEGWVRRGGKGMPAYDEQLSARQIRDVATFVATATRTP